MTRNGDRKARVAVRAAGLLALLSFLLTASPQRADARDPSAEPLTAQAGSAPTASGVTTSAPQTPRQHAQVAAATPAPHRGPSAAVEARISELHRKLRITQAQEPQFKAYADVMRENAQKMEALFAERAKATDKSAVARLRWYAQLTAAHAEAVSKLVAPFEALYQDLSPRQKKVADTLFEQLRQRPAPHRAK